MRLIRKVGSHFQWETELEVPRTIFHYTSFSSLASILETKSIWATHYRFLNDSAEIHAYLDHGWKLLTKMWEGESHPRKWQFLQRCADLMMSEFEDVFVASFSELGDDLSQWRAYCPNGGVSIGFDVRALLSDWVNTGEKDGLARVSCKLERVNYMDIGWKKRFPALLSKIVSHTYDIESVPRNRPWQEKLDAKVDLFESWLGAYAPTCKHGAFAAEIEWRLVVRDMGATVRPIQPRFRAGRSSLIPYLEVALNRDHEAKWRRSLPVRRIYVGPCPNTELARESVERLLVSQGLGRIDVNETKVPYRNW